MNTKELREQAIKRYEIGVHYVLIFINSIYKYLCDLKNFFDRLDTF